MGDTEYRALKRDITITEEEISRGFSSVALRYWATLDGELRPHGPHVSITRDGDTPRAAMANLEEAIRGFGWRLAEV